MRLLDSVTRYLEEFLWRHRQLPSDGSVLVVNDPDIPFSVRPANPIANVAVARDASEFSDLQSQGYSEIILLSDSSFHFLSDGTWQVLDTATDYRPNLCLQSLIFSPHDGRFYYVGSDYQLTEVNLTTSTPGG